MIIGILWQRILDMTNDDDIGGFIVSPDIAKLILEFIQLQGYTHIIKGRLIGGTMVVEIVDKNGIDNGNNQINSDRNNPGIAIEETN